MKENRPFTVGHIPYLNCVPFFHYLSEYGFSGTLISGVPSALNRMLQRSELDVSPSSSFEYARNWRDYLLLPGHSISSAGPVESVLLFSPLPLSDLAEETISITGDSATSINLLRILLREFVGLDQVIDEVPDSPVETLIKKGKPALLIGDRALQMACNRPHSMHRFDLGQLWYEYTGLPFVFALWIARRDSVRAYGEELSTLCRQLDLSRSRFLAEVDSLAEILCPESCLTEQGKAAYWRNIDYGLDEKHLAGLRLFFDLCLKYHLLDDPAQIEFFHPREN
ncbi:MAG: menaquinone biosynthesis protein [Desulfuromonadales bacterium]|nr:menaquinone biosynthesis protein [Desulfuromonadales bacterium]